MVSGLRERTEDPTSEGRARPSRASLIDRAPWLVVAAPVLFNLWVLRAERLAVFHLNDTSVHTALVRWSEGRISAGHLPFDGWFPLLQMGSPFFHHYNTLPHVLGGLVATVFGVTTTVQWTLYLGLALWPLSVYAGARLFELDRWEAAGAALVSPLIVSKPEYGYDLTSYTWRGWGVWTQLFGMWLLPIALPLAWRAVRRGRGYALAALVVGLTFACHFLTGYLALLALPVWVLVKPSQLVTRLRRALLIGVGALLTVAWVVVPLLADTNWSRQSAFDRHTFYYDSFGAGKVLGWLVRGQLFDQGRFPVLSLLAAVGAAVCLVRFRSEERSRALVGVTLLSLVLFFGRPTLGPLVDVLPGGDNVYYHRFVVGVDVGGLLFAGIGAVWLGRTLLRLAGRVRARERVARVVGVLLPAALPIVLAAILLPGWIQVAKYHRDGATWLKAQRAADATDGADVQRLLDRAERSGGGRVYAGMSNGWGRTDYRVNSVPMFAELLDRNVDAIGFTERTVALLSDVETHFNDSILDQYDLFNVRFAILPVGRPVPAGARFVAAAGRHRLYAIPGTGYLEVVDTVAPAITADRSTMNEEPVAFLSSPLLHQRRLPTIAYAGRTPATPSLPAGANPKTSAGVVVTQYATLDDGLFGGAVIANRTAVVLLKVSYHPRMTATVDGAPAAIEMVAPGMIGVKVGPGAHRVEFRYRNYPHYAPLFAVGALTLALLAYLPRRWPELRRRLGPRLTRFAPSRRRLG